MSKFVCVILCCAHSVAWELGRCSGSLLRSYFLKCFFFFLFLSFFYMGWWVIGYHCVPVSMPWIGQNTFFFLFWKSLEDLNWLKSWICTSALKSLNGGFRSWTYKWAVERSRKCPQKKNKNKKTNKKQQSFSFSVFEGFGVVSPAATRGR